MGKIMISYHNALLHVYIDRYMIQINTLDFFSEISLKANSEVIFASEFDNLTFLNHQL